MLDSIILTALLGGALLSVLLGPLGCFVVWRRMAYFGDAIAHASLLGVAFALIFSLPFTAAVFAVALSVAVLLTMWMRDTRFHADTLLGILAHGTLAVGLLMVALSKHNQVDLNGFLFGDILTITPQDVLLIVGLVILGLCVLIYHWKGLVLSTLDTNLASVEGIKVMRLNYYLVAVLAAIIAVSIKLVGVLLITALLIMPAAAARPLTRSPHAMAILAACFSIIAIAVGIGSALYYDAPTGPTIVLVSMLLCLTTLVVARVLKD